MTGLVRGARIVLFEARYELRGLVPNRFLRWGLTILVAAGAVATMTVGTVVPLSSPAASGSGMVPVGTALISTAVLLLFATVFSSGHFGKGVHSDISLLSPGGAGRVITYRMLALGVLAFGPSILMFGSLVLLVLRRFPGAWLPLIALVLAGAALAVPGGVALAAWLGQRMGVERARRVTASLRLPLMFAVSYGGVLLMKIRVDEPLALLLAVGALSVTPLVARRAAGLYRDLMTRADPARHSREPRWGTWDWWGRLSRSSFYLSLPAAVPALVGIRRFAPGMRDGLTSALLVWVALSPTSQLVEAERLCPERWALSPGRTRAMWSLVARVGLPMAIVAGIAGVALTGAGPRAGLTVLTLGILGQGVQFIRNRLLRTLALLLVLGLAVAAVRSW